MADNRRHEEVETALDKIIDNYALTIRTFTVAEVVSYDKKLQSATVQPLLLTKRQGEDAELPLLIEEVPVMHFGNGDWVSTFDLKAGTLVVVGVIDRSIALFKQKGGQTDPKLRRHHNINDAVILGCLNTFNNPVANQQGGVVIQKRDGSLKFKLDDDVVVSKGGASEGDPDTDIMRIEDGQVTITGNLTVSGDVSAENVTAGTEVTAGSINLTSHTHAAGLLLDSVGGAVTGSTDVGLG